MTLIATFRLGNGYLLATDSKIQDISGQAMTTLKVIETPAFFAAAAGLVGSRVHSVARVMLELGELSSDVSLTQRVLTFDRSMSTALPLGIRDARAYADIPAELARMISGPILSAVFIGVERGRIRCHTRRYQVTLKGEEAIVNVKVATCFPNDHDEEGPGLDVMGSVPDSLSDYIDAIASDGPEDPVSFLAQVFSEAARLKPNLIGAPFHILFIGDDGRARWINGFSPAPPLRTRLRT
jgi:hypothetical protein